MTSREVEKKSGWRDLEFVRERSDRGDTMIEILLALIVLGLTSVALIVAFSTTLSASAQHRNLTTSDIAINNYSQQVIAGIEANQDLFSCPAPSLSALISELAIPSPAPNNPTITSVEYWNSTNSTFSTSCIANAAELVTVSLSSGQTMQFVVDSPTAGSNYVGGAPSGLSFIAPTAQTSATSGAALPVSPVVEVFFGNSPDATDLSPVNLTLDQNGSPATGGTLSGCSSNDLNGIITYTGCTISLTTSSAQAVDFTLVAADGTLTATSPVIAVSGSTSSYLSFTTQPAAGYSGSIMTTQPVIKAFLGGTTTVDTTVMSITITTSGSINGTYQLSSCGGTSGYSTTTESAGVVTVTDSAGHGGTFTVSGCDFSGQFYYDINSGAVGTPYTMTASSPNVTSATSQPFAATGYGAAAQMEFIVEPTGGIASSTSATSVTMNSFQVAIEDSWGNVLSGQGQAGYAGSISTKITSSGTALTCTPSSSGGIFTFSGCSAPLGSNLTLTATATGSGSSGVATEQSTTFNNTGPVTSLVWYSNYPTTGDSPQPVAGASGSVMTNQPVLAFEDAGLNSGETGPEVVTADTTSVTFTSSYSSGTQSTVSPNGLLTTCSNLPPINGIISAGNCTFVGLVGTNYTMQATTTSGSTITSPVSSTFSPTGPGPATQLVFAPSPGVEPVAAAAGSPFSTEPVVVVEDAGGNIVSSASTQVEMNSYLYNASSPTNPTVQSGYLLNCSTLAPVNGAVSLIPVSGYLDVEGSCAFGGTVATSYQLVASATGLTSAVSTTFSPSAPGPISQVVLTGCATPIYFQNSCGLSASVEDAYNNIVTTFAGAITFAQSGGTGTASGFASITAVSGSASVTITGTNIGSVPVTASIAGPAFSSPTLTVTVLPIPQIITWTPPGTQTWVAGGAGTFSLGTASDSSGSVVTFASSTPSVCSVSGTTVTMLTAGTCAITPTAPAQGNYSTTVGSPADITINQIAQATLTMSSANSDTYPWSITLSTTGGSGTGAVTYAVTNGTATGCAVNAGVLSATTSGTCIVTATKAADVDYFSTSSAPQTVTFNKATQATLTMSSASTDAYPWSITLSTTGGSGTGAVTYAVTNGTAAGCAVNAGVLTATTAGTCNVTATKATDTDYLSATSAVQTVTFSEAAQATLTISSANTDTYPWAITLTTSGGSGTGAVTYAVTNGTATGCVDNAGVLTASSAGTCSVTATKASDGDYLAASSAAQTVTFNEATQATLTMTSASSSTYPTWSITLTSSGGSGTGAVTYAATNGTATGCAVNSGVLSATTFGTCNVTATKASDGDYLSTTSAVQTVTFNRATQATLTMTSASSSTYPTWSITLSSTGGSGTGAVTYAATNGTATGCAVNAGVLSATTSGTCNVTATKAADADYNSATSAAQTVTFNKATQATITMSSANSETYPWSITLTSTGGSGTGAVTYAATNGTATGCTVNAGALTASTAGTCNVTATKAADTDYLSATSAAQTVTFNKATQATLTISSANSDTYPWAITLTTTGGSGSGAVTYAVTNGSATGCVDNAGVLTASTAGTCSVTATKASDGNYLATSSAAQTVTFTEATQATLTISSANSDTYPWAITLATTGGSGSGAVTYAVTNGSATGCVDTAGVLSASTSGTCSVTATKASDGDYLSASSAAQTVTFSKANQATLTLSTTSGLRTGLTLATAGGSGAGAVTYSVTNGSATGCAVNSGVLTSTGAGTCNVTATKATDTDYNSATTGAVTVTLANSLTITSPTSASPENPGHDGTATFTLSGTGFQTNATVTGNGSATVDSYTWTSPTTISVTVTGTGATGATGTFTVANPGGGNVTSQTGSFLNG